MCGETAVKVERGFVLNVGKVPKECAESRVTVSHTVSVASRHC